MNKTVCVVTLLLAVGGVWKPSPTVEAQVRRPTQRSTVVKVHANRNQPNLNSPWRRGDTRGGSGSGVWIGGRRVLTNQHVVNYATQIAVQPYGSSEQVSAEVLFTSPQMDLAILELESDDPFADQQPPKFAERVPELGASVKVLGFPLGGNSLSVTEGVVSRVEFVNYRLGVGGLRVQVDAAINPGNSGGPAFVDDEIIGIAFQKRNQSENIGYLISSHEVVRFLEDVEDGSHDGKSLLPIAFQGTLNQGLRSSLGLGRAPTGVWVREVKGSKEDYPIRVDDVITHIGSREIDNRGQCKLTEGLNVRFDYFVPAEAIGDEVPLRIVRDGVAMEVRAPVGPPLELLMPPLDGSYPDYFVLGPLVLTPAAAEHASAVEAVLTTTDTRRRIAAAAVLTLWSRRQSPLMTRRFDAPSFDGEQLVLVANWFPHRLARGYGSPKMQVVDRVNDVRVRNLAHLVQTVRDLDSEYIEFDFADRQVESLVFDRRELLASTESILSSNGIPRQGSAELLEIWDACR